MKPGIRNALSAVSGIVYSLVISVVCTSIIASVNFSINPDIVIDVYIDALLSNPLFSLILFPVSVFFGGIFAGLISKPTSKPAPKTILIIGPGMHLALFGFIEQAVTREFGWNISSGYMIAIITSFFGVKLGAHTSIVRSSQKKVTASIFHKCGGELIQKSYYEDGQRLILYSSLMLPFILFGTILPLFPFVIMILLGSRLKKKKPEEYFTCKKCYLKIQLADLDSGSAL